jgi:hypothetical protein
MKGPLGEAQSWGVRRDGRSMALLSIHIVAVVIEWWREDVIGCGGEAGMPTRVATRGVGAVGGMSG